MFGGIAKLEEMAEMTWDGHGGLLRRAHASKGGRISTDDRMTRSIWKRLHPGGRPFAMAADHGTSGNNSEKTAQDAQATRCHVRVGFGTLEGRAEVSRMRLMTPPQPEIIISRVQHCGTSTTSAATIASRMAEVSPHKLHQLPPEMLEFTLLKTSGALAPRLGRIAVAGRKTILTPAFIGNTSRGIVPHVSQDNFRKTDSINGVYVPLEDCMNHRGAHRYALV